MALASEKPLYTIVVNAMNENTSNELSKGGEYGASTLSIPIQAFANLLETMFNRQPP